MVGACENPLQGTHTQHWHGAGPSENADQVFSDFAEESLQLSEFQAFPVIKYTQGSRPHNVWGPTEVGNTHRCESITTDMEEKMQK